MVFFANSDDFTQDFGIKTLGLGLGIDIPNIGGEGCFFFFEALDPLDQSFEIIGGESQVIPVEELSVVSAPYEVDGQIVGTLGVIGPTRMAYDRMIQIVDITAKLVGNALSQGK